LWKLAYRVYYKSVFDRWKYKWHVNTNFIHITSKEKKMLLKGVKINDVWKSVGAVFQKTDGGGPH
jgi:hypothetical protein